MNQAPVRVLYILGWGRSGTTILDNILGQVDGCFSCGELRYLWDRNLIENRLCGCGLEFSECSFWKKVLDRAYGGAHNIPTQQVISWRDQARTRHLPFLFSRSHRRGMDPRIAEYGSYLESLYRAIRDVAAADIVVDSSKFPSYAWVLSQVEKVELSIVHIVRDPRGVAYSWLRKKRRLDGGTKAFLDRHGPIKSTAIWSAWNIAGERMADAVDGRYLRFHYEEFARSPRAVIDAILQLVGKSGCSPPFQGKHKMSLAPNHTVSGNPVRMKSGVVTIAEDDEWKRGLGLGRSWLVTALAWPLMLRYGYRIFGKGLRGQTQ